MKCPPYLLRCARDKLCRDVSTRCHHCHVDRSGDVSVKCPGAVFRDFSAEPAPSEVEGVEMTVHALDKTDRACYHVLLLRFDL